LNKPKISVIGAGYVGLCTAVGFSSKGYSVIASDVDAEKAAKINEGVPPFHEPGLQEKLTDSVNRGNLKCLVDQAEKAVIESDLTFVAVGTPSKPDGSIDLRFIESSARDIGRALSQKGTYHVVVVKSTVVPGTTQNVVKPILEEASKKSCGAGFGLCMNPEFLRQGSAFHDTVNADRLVIGAFDKRSGDFLEDLYRDFYSTCVPPIIRTTLSTAELIKYASNSMLATKISFINTMANICEKIPGADGFRQTNRATLSGCWFRLWRFVFSQRRESVDCLL
jgi:UDPglucose 6-dehydrogenase